MDASVVVAHISTPDALASFLLLLLVIIPRMERIDNNKMK